MTINLKAARVNANLTQLEAARRLNISKNTLCNYEMYRTKPDIKVAKSMAELYNIALDDIKFFNPELC